ncbi:MAG: phosphatidylinositol-specific phospholipase C/glycerophosphodiester phosphodiesterase family protein [Planctomycetales bacterium]|nr:phosphatidylinositol-specific phospholipase C/glycerophosphodiester phosphodiesterase family protein [Planctomycetales bacterium]
MRMTAELNIGMTVSAMFSRTSVSSIAFLLALAAAAIGAEEENAAVIEGENLGVVVAHSHNDYYHERPLLDALQLGFTSIEADVFLVDGQLLVGHGRLELRRERTLEELYLKPLKKFVNERKSFTTGQTSADEGSTSEKDASEAAAPNMPKIWLLVDIKQDGVEAYAVLDRLLSQYADLLTRTENGQQINGAVTVVVSGDRAQQQITDDQTRLVGIDGRQEDLDSDRSAELVPWISENYRSHFTWNGEGEMPQVERHKLQEMVAKAHAHGRLLRFWATPETPQFWSTLLANGVDILGTDQLEELSKFLQQPPAPK